MPRNNKPKHFQAPDRFINIGFMGERYEREIKAFKNKIEHQGEHYRFECDHEQPDNRARYGRWVKEEVFVNG